MNTSLEATATSFTSPTSGRVAETTHFTYEASSGLLTKTVTEDGYTTHLCYYAKQASAEIPDRSDQVPKITHLLKGFKLQQGEAAVSALVMGCPELPDASSPPLLAQCSYLVFPDGSRSEMSILLFGYANAHKDYQGILTPDVILNLEGVTVDTSTTPWTLAKAEGRDGLLVSLQQVKNSDDSGQSKTETTSTRWYKNNEARQTQILKETTTVEAGGGTLWSKSESPFEWRALKLTATVAQHVRSARSGRVLRETTQDEFGRPTSMAYHTYDACSRPLSSTTYDWDGGCFTSGRANGTALANTTHTWTDSLNGTWVTSVGPDGRTTRTLLDGLQRPVRRELQRKAEDSGLAGDYVCLEEIAYGAGGETQSCCTYDYHPGGLCVRNDGASLPTHLRDWFWRSKSQQDHIEADGSQGLSIALTTGTVLKGPLHCQVQTQKNHPDGRVTLALRHQHWNKVYKRMDDQALHTEQSINARGHCDLIKETVGAISREWKHEYDELGRRTLTKAPNGTVVKWAFEGLSNTPVRVSIKPAVGDEVQLGRQALRGGGNAGDQVASRTVGTENSARAFSFYDMGYQRPDGTRVWNESSADGNTVVWYSERTKSRGVRTKIASFTYNEITQSMHTERPAYKANLQSRISAECHAPRLLGQFSAVRSIRGLQQRTRVLHSLRGNASMVESSNGAISRAWTDAQSRRTRVRRGQFEYRYRYAAQGEIEQMIINDRSTGHTMSISYGYDNFGRETQRTYRLNGMVKSRYEQCWSLTGQLLSKAWYRHGDSTATRTETYTYEADRNELKHWAVTAAKGFEIKDANNQAIKEQAYTYDVLGNVATCTTLHLDGASETRAYAYTNPSQPTERTQVTVTRTPEGGKAGQPTILKFAYDDNGSLTRDALGQTITYTPEGQVHAVSMGADKQPITRYEYDQHGRLATQWDEAKQQRRVLQYHGDLLCGEIWLDAKNKPLRQHVFDEEAGFIVNCRELAEDEQSTQTFFMLQDPQNGSAEEYSMNSEGDWESQSVGFTPWGEASLENLNTLNSGLGYNGQRVDPVTGGYHLGNGQRVYAPRHQAFIQRDSLSPFDEGGLNDCAYCAGRDPVNWHDPSGRIMISRREESANLASLDEMIRDTRPPHHEPAAWWEWMLLAYGTLLVIGLSVMTGGAAGALMLAFGLVAFGLGAAELAMRHNNPALSEKLGWASLAVDLIDVSGKGLVKAGRGLLNAGRRAVKGLSSIRELRRLRKLSTAFSAPIKNVVERGHLTLPGGSHPLQSIHNESFTLHSVPNSKGLFINGHGIRVEGLKRGGPNGPNVPEYFSTDVAPEIDFYTREGLKAMMLGKSYDSILMGLSKPSERIHSAVVPNYIISELSETDMLTEFPSITGDVKSIFHSALAKIANSHGFDYLEVHGAATFDSLLNVLQLNGHYYNTVNGMFCRGTASLIAPANVPQFAYDITLAAIYSAHESVNYVRGVRKI